MSEKVMVAMIAKANGAVRNPNDFETLKPPWTLYRKYGATVLHIICEARGAVYNKQGAIGTVSPYIYYPPLLRPSCPAKTFVIPYFKYIYTLIWKVGVISNPQARFSRILSSLGFVIEDLMNAAHPQTGSPKFCVILFVDFCDFSILFTYRCNIIYLYKARLPSPWPKPGEKIIGSAYTGLQFRLPLDNKYQAIQEDRDREARQQQEARQAEK
jgi:hypothetical protein